MKKVLLKPFAAALVLALALSACSGNKEEAYNEAAGSMQEAPAAPAETMAPEMSEATEAAPSEAAAETVH
jgi:hypothetical protein